MTRTAEGLDAVDCAGVLIYPNTTAFMSSGCAISAYTDAAFSRLFFPAVAAEPSGLDARNRCDGLNSEDGR